MLERFFRLAQIGWNLKVAYCAVSIETTIDANLRNRWDAMRSNRVTFWIIVAGFLSVSTFRANADSPPRAATVIGINGHALLRTPMKDDKYAMGRLATNLVVAKVENGKVVDMSAGQLPMKRVKVLTANQNALSDGYCFANNPEFTCYWYAPSDVIEDSSWFDYDPSYDQAPPEHVSAFDKN
jgi:hypothetical protein